MRVRLTQVTASGKKIAEPVEGEAVFPPIAGRVFRMVADDGRDRWTRGKVVDVMPGGLFKISTGAYFHVQVIDMIFQKAMGQA